MSFENGGKSKIADVDKNAEKTNWNQCAVTVHGELIIVAKGIHHYQ